MYADKQPQIYDPPLTMGDNKRLAQVFGCVLQELRQQRGLTQDRLAELANTERSHISSLERAERGPALSTIFRLADALGMPASQLIALVESRFTAIPSPAPLSD